MAAHMIQYHHYIPRFILKHFAYTRVEAKKDGLLHVFDLSSEQFCLGEVAKTCGAQNLYYNANDTDLMIVEHLLSKLEAETGIIFGRIRSAVAEGANHVDILEKDIHVLFKFMNLSLRCSEWYRDEVKSPYRENSFMFQWQFEASKKGGRHENLLADAKKTDDNAAANTYKSFIETYALQIWKAADGYEFFLNERLVDFEGDTESCLGVERKETGSQLIWMTREDMIHLVLPISPEVAVIFCNESRCWESPFAETMHRLKIPYPENSLLKNAPHVDVINVHIPSERRGRKTWPATMAWRVNMGTLSRYQHRIIASYSLGHIRSLAVVRSRKRFGRAKRELEMFTMDKARTYKSRGTRFGYQYQDGRRHPNGKVPPPSEEQKTRMVETYRSNLDEVFATISNANAVPQMTKENSLKFRMAIRTLKHLGGIVTSSPKSDNDFLDTCIMHPVLKTAFEAAYPTKPPDHRDLNNIDFWRFFENCVGKTTFAQLSLKIEQKINSVAAEDFEAQFEASKGPFQCPAESLCQEDDYDMTMVPIKSLDVLRMTYLQGPLYDQFTGQPNVLVI